MSLKQEKLLHEKILLAQLEKEKRILTTQLIKQIDLAQQHLVLKYMMRREAETIVLKSRRQVIISELIDRDIENLEQEVFNYRKELLALDEYDLKLNDSITRDGLRLYMLNSGCLRYE